MTGCLGIVPARAGSKGIPGKNLEELGGKPMVQWTLEAAVEANRLDDFVVTTDDPGVLEVAEGLGAGRLLRRPSRLAGDRVGLEPVLEHALDWYVQESGQEPDHLVLLQPTTPFRTAGDIDAALGSYEDSDAESLVSASEAFQHPEECFTVDPDTGELRFVMEDDSDRRQDYPDVYFLDGGIYATSVARFRRVGTAYDEGSAVHLVPRSHSLDVDEPFDLALARGLLLYVEQADRDLLGLGNQEVLDEKTKS